MSLQVTTRILPQRASEAIQVVCPAYQGLLKSEPIIIILGFGNRLHHKSKNLVPSDSNCQNMGL